MQGEEPIYFVHKPSFHAANHRRQTILEVDLPSDIKFEYQTLKSQYPDEIVTFITNQAVDLTQVIHESGDLFGYLHSERT